MAKSNINAITKQYKLNRKFNDNMDLLKYCRKVAKRFNQLYNTWENDFFIYPYDLYNCNCTF